MTQCAINLTPWFSVGRHFPTRAGIYELRLRDPFEWDDERWLDGKFFAQWNGARWERLREVGNSGLAGYGFDSMSHIAFFDEWRGLDGDPSKCPVLSTIFEL